MIKRDCREVVSRNLQKSTGCPTFASSPLPINHDCTGKPLALMGRMGGNGQQFGLIHNHPDKGKTIGIANSKGTALQQTFKLGRGPWPGLGKRRGMSRRHFFGANQSSITGGACREGAASAVRA